MPATSTFSGLFPPTRRVVILDGGMGTTLQAPPFELALDSALWSSELLADEAGCSQLDRLHRTWIDAGADIVETCTYQSSLPLFLPSSRAPTAAESSTALATMTAALPVACASCANHPPASSTASSSRRAQVALSLGPYGSALQPGQEYTGAYPPPFGPAASAAPDAQPASSAEALAAVPLPLDAVRGAGVSDDEAHLAAWHLQRLVHFSESSAAAGPDDDARVGLVAFETVPSLAEVRAIRRAAHVFSVLHPDRPQPPFYISLVFPRATPQGAAADVRFPDAALAHLESLDAQLAVLVDAVLAPADGLAQPAGLGFNCTSPLAARGVVRALGAAVAAARPTSLTSPAGLKPWLVLYPDGGAVYDVRSRTWSHPAGLTDASWAALVADAVGDALACGEWEGVVAGGCCKAGPGAIRALRDEVERRGWRE
ncbi:hypothetical protein JCM3775_003315 [Rhodotorula graminis]